jgi:ABC-type Fe3+ transport system substrate-binding protein
MEERMRREFLRFLVLSLMLSPAAVAFAADSPAVIKAKSVEAAVYPLPVDRNEIIARAKTEGRLRVLAEMEPRHIKASTAAFMKKYPFINLYIEEITAPDQYQRNLLELKSGGAKDWDLLSISVDFYSEYLALLSKIDLLGMAERGIIQIPSQMIDSKNRNVVAFFSRFQVTAFNKNLVPGDKAPRTWEDLLKPEFKTRKFAADIRPTEIAGLVPAWGVEKTLDYARKIAAQQPIWVRGGSRTLTAIMTGEIPMMVGPNYTAVKRAQTKDPMGVLQYVTFEPVPVRLTVAEGIYAASQNPNAALLWLEWMASHEAQKLADEYEPLASSVYVRGGAIEQELKGKSLSVVSWEHHQNMEKWQARIFEAYGFPREEPKR